MNSKIAIYLAGKIKKAHENPNEYHWSENDINLIKQAPFDIDILNPAVREDDLEDQKSVFGRDMMQVFSSDIVFVDARDRRGLGVGAEMMWAKLNRIPVVTLAPINSHYNKKITFLLGIKVENWCHPFVESLSDLIVENIADSFTWIKDVFSNKDIKIKGSEFMHEAMRYYKDNQFEKDSPMKTIIENNEILEFRLKSLKREKELPSKMKRAT